MLTLLSPSKGQDFKSFPPSTDHTTPFFINQSQQLIDVLAPLTTQSIQELMSVSEKIAQLNAVRFHNFKTPFTLDNSQQALYAFTGDVYSQIEAMSYSTDVLQFGQHHLRILSGLYGLLRPLDLIQPYRLEMKTKLATRGADNLYQFWGTHIQEKIADTLTHHANPKVINLASNEYFKVIKPKKKLDVLTINFKEIKDNKARVVAIFAKRARGLMANYILKNRIDDHNQLKNFDIHGYTFSTADSDTDQFTFTRKQPTK